VVNLSMLVFWVVMPYGLVGRCPEDEDSMFLQNAGIYLQVYMDYNPEDQH
jgi:hypothetical protein